MGFPTAEILGLIYQLLPGFIAAWIFYGLTAHPKKDPFERSVQALIFTGIVKMIVVPIKSVAIWLGGLGFVNKIGMNFGEWNKDSEYVLSVSIGIALGFAFTYFANTNKFHTFLYKRFKTLTKRTSYPSEWFSALNEQELYVCLHLKGETENRRIVGYPNEWPDAPNSGHFVLINAEWLLSDNRRISNWPAIKTLIPATEVEMVEIMDGVFQPLAVDRENQAAVIQPLIELHKNNP